jgi:hypothetical protein
MALPRPSYASVTATLALVVALSTGGAMAAGKITGKDIGKNAVASKHIKNGTIKLKDLSKAAQPGSGPQGPPGAPGPTLAFDFQNTTTYDLGNAVPANTCMGTDSPILVPRAGSDGTIADDLLFVTNQSNTFTATVVTGRPEGTNRVRVTACNFNAVPRDFSALKIRVASVDPN